MAYVQPWSTHEAMMEWTPLSLSQDEVDTTIIDLGWSGLHSSSSYDEVKWLRDVLNHLHIVELAISHTSLKVLARGTSYPL